MPQNLIDYLNEVKDRKEHTQKIQFEKDEAKRKMDEEVTDKNIEVEADATIKVKENQQV